MEKNKFGGCIYSIYFGTLFGEYGEAVKKKKKVKMVQCYVIHALWKEKEKKKQRKCSMKYSIV